MLLHSKFKDRIPDVLCINVVYKYQCVQCGALYVGETIRHLKTRSAEHKGISVRTGKPLSTAHSNILDHAMQTGHPVLDSSFSVVSVDSPDLLKILESIQIRTLKPTLNDRESSYQLLIL